MPPLRAADVWREAAAMAERFADVAENPFARHENEQARELAVETARQLRVFARALRHQGEEDRRSLGDDDVTPVRRTIVTPDALPEHKRRKTPRVPIPKPFSRRG